MTTPDIDPVAWQVYLLPEPSLDESGLTFADSVADPKLAKVVAEGFGKIPRQIQPPKSGPADLVHQLSKDAASSAAACDEFPTR